MDPCDWVCVWLCHVTVAQERLSYAFTPIRVGMQACCQHASISTALEDASNFNRALKFLRKEKKTKEWTHSSLRKQLLVLAHKSTALQHRRK